MSCEIFRIELDAIKHSSMYLFFFLHFKETSTNLSRNNSCSLAEQHE